LKVWKDISATKAIANAVLTTGTFDGVHCGHQSIIQRLNDIAREVGGESVMISFHPHPRTIVNGGQTVSLLSPFDEKVDLLARYGLQNFVVVPFTRAFSEMTPDAYLKKFLLENFDLNTIVIGYNHRFGRNREGDLDFLARNAAEGNYKIEEIGKKEIDAVSVSSTKIRELLRDGSVEKAIALLGHQYFIRGTVIKGQQLGQKMGFPTANILVKDNSKLIPRNGVYVVNVKVGDKAYQGMLNIGVRPTVSGDSRSIETNIFDFHRDIYGEKIEVSFVQFLREEKKFDGVEELISQLQKDKLAALEVFKQ